MRDRKGRQGRMVWCFLLSTAACLASGAALATCTPGEGSGTVPCYIKVQPIDVCPNGVMANCAPFNTASATGYPNGSTSNQTPPNLSQAGYPPQTLTATNAPTALVGTRIPNNSTSNNPIGFVVDPATGQYPGDGVSAQWPRANQTPTDVTRQLLHGMGIELVWIFPMTVSTANYSTLSVSLATTGTQVASCTGFISGTTLTINSCTTFEGSELLAVYDFLSGTGIAPGTFITALGSGSGGAGSYTVNTSQTAGSSKKPITITVDSFTLTSSDFQTLSDQIPSNTSNPCAIRYMTIPLSSPCTMAPSSPLSSDPGTINMFFVNDLSPPTSMPGTLYGFSWIGNNGVAIGGKAFFAPTPLQARPDTITHELGHNAGVDHDTYAAGPWIPPNNGSSYMAPAGIVAPKVLTPNPFNGECDPLYPACPGNLMTAGSLRTTTTLSCILSTSSTCASTSFVQGAVDQVTNPSQENTTTLPESQVTKALGSGLLFNNANQPLNFSGLLNPIPRETTTAQLGTGDGSTDRVIFDLSSPIDGKPGETLVAWVLTVPDEQTFTRDGGFHIISQSRQDLVQEVNYYPNPVNNPLSRNIAYQTGDGNNADTPGIDAAGSSPCASPTAECLVVRFQMPGLGEHDSISFSNSILSGDAAITNDDLCKAKITYIFSDGFVTTSNFGRCPPASLPLVSSSWHPDPYVAPHIVKSDLLLAQMPPPTRPCNQDPVTGQCPSTDQPVDIDVTTEGGQLGRSCDGGATLNNPVTGIINGPVVTISGNQSCTYQSCEFLGSLTIDGGHAFLQNCKVDGNLTMTSGTLTLTASTLVMGNVQISNGSAVSTIANHFAIGPDAAINGSLTLQNLPQNEGGTICDSTISGGLTANNNQSSIEIGQTPNAPQCDGNAIAGGLNCKGNNPPPTGGGNMVTGGVSPQCAALVQ